MAKEANLFCEATYILHTIKPKAYAKQRQGHDCSLQVQQGGRHQFEANRQHWNKNNGDKLDINKFRLEIRNGSNHQSREILEEHRDGKGGRKKRPEPSKGCYSQEGPQLGVQGITLPLPEAMLGSPPILCSCVNHATFCPQMK